MAARGARANPRALAARAVHAVLDAGRSLDDVLPTLLAQTGERALVQELAYGTLRFAHQLLAIRSAYLDRAPRARDRDLGALLLVGLYQLLHLRIAPYAAVTETVDAAGALGKAWARDMVNAVLRRAAAGIEDLRARIRDEPALRLSHPDWLIELAQSAWPHDWEAIAAAGNARPPMALRINLRRTSRAAYLERLAGAGLAARPLEETDCGVVLAEPVAVDRLPGFAQGEASVQDGAAQLAAVLLDPQPGEQLLDACAAPGGKAAHLMERCPDCALTALDVSGARLERLRDNFARLGLDATVREGDGATPADWWDGRPFDRILLDAPCSGSGVIRRHPDIKHLRRRGDVERFAGVQAALLAGLWPTLRPGGKLLYVTCSFLPTENESVIAAFLAAHPGARSMPLALPCGRPRGAGWQILPGEHGLDGFFYAMLEKHGR